MKRAVFFKQTYVLGGGEQYCIFLAQALKDLGYESRIYTNYRPLRELAQKNSHYSAWLYTGFDAASIRMRILLFIFWPIYLLLGVITLTKAGYGVRGKERIVFLSNINEKILFTLPALLLGYRVFWVENLNFSDWFLKNPLRYLYLSLSKVVDSIIVASDSVKADVMSFLSNSNKVHTIYFAFQPHVVELFSQEAIAQARNETVFIAISRLEEEKGIDVLIQAFVQLQLLTQKNIALDIVGDGSARENLRKLVPSQLQNKIRFVGQVGNVFKYLAASDILVLPSKVRESFGIVILEAMLMKKAVIASDIGGVPEIVQHGKNGLLVTPGDTASLVVAMEMLLNDQALANRYGQEGYKTATQKFSFAKSTEVLRELL